jgi:hypothetical protein
MSQVTSTHAPARHTGPEQTAPAGSGFAMDPVYGVRVAGISADHIVELRWVRTWTKVDEVLRLTDHLTVTAATLCETLYKLIGDNPHPWLKPLLVTLRRDLFAQRKPNPRVWSAVVRAALPTDLVSEIDHWLADLDLLAGMEAELPGILAAETNDRTEALRAVVALPDFQFGVAHSTAILSAKLTDWLGGGTVAPTRKVILRLARYLARAAMKTSPYATFTASGLGAWDDHPQVLRTGELRFRGVAEVDRRLLKEIWRTTMDRPEVRSAMRLRTNPSAVEEAGRVVFLGPGPTEAINAVTASSTLRTLLDLFGERQGTTVFEARRRILGEQPDPVQAAELTQFVDRLVDCGLLERLAPFHEFAAEPIEGLVEWLATRTMTMPELPELAGAVRRYATLTSLEDRIRWQDYIRALSGNLGEKFECVLPARAVARPNCVISGVPTTLGVSAWQHISADLNAARQLLTVFDRSLPLKIAAADFFLDQYGDRATTVPFLSFYQHINDPAGTPATPLRVLRRLLSSKKDSALETRGDEYPPRIRTLAWLRSATWAAIDALPGDEPVLTSEVIDRLTADLPRFARPPEALSCYVQIATIDGETVLVTNAISAGPRRGTGRIEYLLDKAGVRSPDRGTPQRTPATAALAEFQWSGDTNLNLRPLMQRSIGYPFSDDDPDTPALRLGDLAVSYDSEQELLRLLAPNGTIVRPVHRGLLAETTLPPAQTFLVQAFGLNTTQLLPGWALRRGLRSPPPTGIERIPRLRVGSVVLARRCWRMRVGEIPTPAAGEGDTRYLLRLARWLSENDLPRRFYLRVLRQGSARDLLASKSRKPLYVDATNWFLLQDMLRALQHDDQFVVLEEALPDVADIPSYTGAGKRVTEFIVDLYATTNGE